MGTSVSPSCTHQSFRLRHCRRGFRSIRVQHLHARHALLSKRRVRSQGLCSGLQCKILVCSASTGFHQQRLAAEVRTSPKGAIGDISVQIRFIPKLALIRHSMLTLLLALLHAPDHRLPVQGGTERR